MWLAETERGRERGKKRSVFLFTEATQPSVPSSCPETTLYQILSLPPLNLGIHLGTFRL
jgi:hypothetical protein